jgi:hypothetical protein
MLAICDRERSLAQIQAATGAHDLFIIRPSPFV